jgi:hypothetical protein
MDNLYVLFFPSIDYSDDITNSIIEKYKDNYENIIFTDEIEKYESDNDIIVIYCDIRQILLNNIDDDINESSINLAFNKIKPYLDLFYNKKLIEKVFLDKNVNFYSLPYDNKMKILKLLEKYILDIGLIKLNHCIGDSHASFFSGSVNKDNFMVQPQWPSKSNDVIPLFRSYRIGPSTAYNLMYKKYILDDIISKSVNKEKDRVVFCFGEVDCRVHVRRFMDINNVIMEVVVNQIVERYMEVINFYKNNGYDVAVWGPIASFPDEHIDKVNLDFMITYEKVKDLGNTKERNLITKFFNERLKEECEKNDIDFVTIFYDMVNENLLTNKTYVDKAIHLNRNSIPLMINQFEKKKLI